MPTVIERHTQDFDEIRQICLSLYGLDCTSTLLYQRDLRSGDPGATGAVLQRMISSAALQLAAALRVNIYQGKIPKNAPIDQNIAAIYYSDRTRIQAIDVKLISDKILHADTLSKDVLPKEVVGDAKPMFHLEGTHRGRTWYLDVCLDLLAERILEMLDDLERDAG